MEHKLNEKFGIAAVRVSSDKQGLQGDSPESQLQQIQLMADRMGITISKKFEFIESGSKEIQPNQKAIDYCLDKSNNIGYFFIKSIDRFTRGGSKFYSKLKDQLDQRDINLVDVYGIIGQTKINTLSHLGIEYKWSKYSPTFKSEILEAERAKDEVRDILTRLIGAEIEYTRLGFAVRQPPFGFVNIKIETAHGKRTILKAHPIESKFIITMFELRALGNKSDEEIVNIVNGMGYMTRRTSLHDKENRRQILGMRGGKPLTVKLLQSYISKPVYAGYKYDSWTRENPVKAQFGGLVNIETFNKANKGKLTIVDNGGLVKIYKGVVPSWLLRRNKNNPDFAYKQYVMCPHCRKPLLGSASRGKSGKHFPAYHCNRLGHYFRVPSSSFEEVISSLTKRIRINDKLKEQLTQALTREWENRKKQNITVDISTAERIKAIDLEINSLAEKIKIISSPDVIRKFEADVEKAAKEKERILNQPPTLTLSSMELSDLIDRATFYMEHLQELLFSAEDKIRNAAMFGLLFDDLPTYTDLVNGTPKLSPLIELNDEFNKGENLASVPAGSRTQIDPFGGDYLNPLDYRNVPYYTY